MPVSMIVEHSSTLKRWWWKSRITASRSRSPIWPCATRIRASGSSVSSFSSMLLMVSTSLCRKYTCPPRLSSRSTASRMMPWLKLLTKVLMDRRRCGAVAITEKSRRPSSDIASVRGMGVAVSVSTSTSARKRLQSFFLLHAEAMLFIEDDQAEVVELHILLDQLVRADDDVQLAIGQILQRLRHFLGGAEARQLGDLDRPIGEAVGEALEVLLGEQRGGHEHRDLLAFHRRDEGGAQCDFGLAEADIAADEPVHRLAGLQVEQHGFDGGGLVGGLLETEAGRERFVVVIRAA